MACLALVLTAVTAHGKDSDEPVVAGELGKRLDTAVQAAGGQAFWGAVLVARGGEVLLAKGYGMADFADEPNRPTTLFELASATKQVTATAILHLEQRKKLSTDDTLDRFLKGVPDDKKEITLHQLITHTSGLSPNLGVPYASNIARKEYVRQMLAEPLATPPGTKFAYCNAGYALLAAVVEEVTRKSFEDYVERNLFKPAKMTDTGFIGDRDLIRTKRASVRRTTQPGTFTAADWHRGWGYRGMGGVVTTVWDLLRWDRALRTDDILGPAAREKLHTPVLEGYACGWRVDVTDRGTRRAHHSGSVAGYGINLVRYLEEDVAVFVLSNAGKAALDVTTALDPLLEPVPIAATIDRGGYTLPPNRVLVLPPEKLRWAVKRKKGAVHLRLLDGKRQVVEIRFPGESARKVALELAQAVREYGDAGAGEPRDAPLLEASMYLQAYDPGRPEFDLEDSLSVSVRPRYEGQNRDGTAVEDRRPVLILEDRSKQAWPVMVHMNLPAARRLQADVEKALGD